MKLVREVPIEKYKDICIIEIILGQGIFYLKIYNYTSKWPSNTKARKVIISVEDKSGVKTQMGR